MNLDEAERNISAMLAAMYDSLGGVATVSGTNTLTVTITEDWAALADGLLLAIKTPNANTGAVTLNPTVPTVGALGAKAIRLQGDTALSGGEMKSGGTYSLRYDSTYNSSAGAWVLTNPTVSAPAVVTSGQTLVAFTPLDNEPPSSNYATFDVRNGHPVLTFPDGVVYAAIFTGMMPSKYGGGGVTVLINWMSDGTSTNKVCFSAQIERMDVGTTDFDSDSFGTQVIDTTGVAGSSTSGIQSQSSIALTTGTNMDSVVAGDEFRLKITRETGQTNDTNTGNIQVTSIEIKET
jgi:hypothetical protein